MWKKEDAKPGEPPTTPEQQQPQRQPDRPAMAPRASGEHAVIGRSITIRGDVTGDEDIMIQGRIQGSVDLRQNSVTVGGNGVVEANITGRNVTVEGQVTGNIDGGEQVTLRSSSHVQGDITAPRVVLENGARFRGLVDMGDVESRSGGNGGRGKPAMESKKGPGSTSGTSGGTPKGNDGPDGKDKRADTGVPAAV